MAGHVLSGPGSAQHGRVASPGGATRPKGSPSSIKYAPRPVQHLARAIVTRRQGAAGGASARGNAPGLMGLAAGLAQARSGPMAGLGQPTPVNRYPLGASKQILASHIIQTTGLHPLVATAWAASTSPASIQRTLSTVATEALAGAKGWRQQLQDVSAWGNVPIARLLAAAEEHSDPNPGLNVRNPMGPVRPTPPARRGGMVRAEDGSLVPKSFYNKLGPGLVRAEDGSIVPKSFYR